MSLTLQSIRKVFPGSPPVHALRGIDFDVQPGRVEALIGPNGAGKTTTVDIICGLIRADGGTVQLDGIDLSGPKGRELRRRIGCAPQEEALIPVMTVSDNLRLYAELAGLRGAAATRRIAEVAEAFLVGDLLKRKVGPLSGGQRRRVHNAIALIAKPSVLLLDEPTAGVDPATRGAILDIVRRLAQEEGVAVCYSTHYLPEVVALDAHVTCLDHGSVIARGSVGDLIRAHAQSFIELHFDGQAPTIAHGTIVGDMVRVAVENPRTQMGAVMSSLGDHISRLTSIEVIEGDLDLVFTNLTGRSYEEADTNEAEHVGT